ncbi:MAG: DUF2058 domain-containing protein [Motiliproteus sp.]|nr:DUF2058 domain-containing protein [Motiliproteus sp.]MCW9052904.1 DUF2058 domain-containing protein [Motiliproteus sp.]
MSNSLHDQLLKAGLVDKKKAQASKKQKHKQRTQGKGITEAEQAKLDAQKAREEKAARDRELNRQRKEDADRKAIKAQIRQLIEMNRISNRDGEVAYNFTDQRKIKRIYITDALVDQLSRGHLAIVSLNEQYELVPTKVADKIRQRDESVIVQYIEPSAQDDEDDPYAEYKIPDDLMW